MNIKLFCKVFLFYFFSIFLTANIFSAPYITLNENTITSNSLKLTGNVSKGINLYLIVGGSQIRNENFPQTNQNINITNSLRNLNIGVGEEVYFKNINPSGNITIKFQNEELFIDNGEIGKLGPFEEEGNFNYELLINENPYIESQGELEVSFSKITPFNFSDLKKDEFIDGENLVILELRSLRSNEILLRKNFSIYYDKYPNKINLTSNVNITKNSKIKIEGKTSITNHPLRYILNPPKVISSQSQLQEITNINSNGNFEFFINNLFEGKNLIKVFSLNPNNLVAYTGEAQISITKDTKPPKIEIVEGLIAFETNNLYTNIENLKINITTNEKANITYIFNGRNEEIEILETGNIDDIDFLSNFSVVKKDNNLEFKFTKKENFETAYLRYSYNNIEKKLTNFKNSTATILINLNEDDKEIEIVFYNGKGLMSQKNFVINPYTFEDIESIEKQANKVGGNNTWSIEEPLIEGKNTLLIIAKDLANNSAKLSKVVFFSKEKPKLIRETLKPEEIFSGSRTTHFFTSQIEGKTNKPFVEGKVFTFPKNSVAQYLKISGETSSKSGCENFNFLVSNYIEEEEEIRRSGENTQRTYIQTSLLNLINQEIEFETDENGNFGSSNPLKALRIIFQRGELKNDEGGSKVQKVKSENTICFLLKDRYGNTNIEEFTVNYDAGNTVFKIGQISSTPNIVYSAEIEQTGGGKIGNGVTRVGLIANFQYQGNGKIVNIDRGGVSIDIDRSLNKDSKYIQVVQNELKYNYNQQTNNLLVYVPINLLAQNIKPDDYPSTLNLGLQAKIRYEVDNIEVPIDDQPVYFQLQLRVEKPLDFAHFLTPKLLEKGIKILEESLKKTKKLQIYLQYATLGGALTCQAAKFYYQFRIKLANDNGNHKLAEEYERILYRICDRIVCLPSPPEKPPENADDESGIFEIGDEYNFNAEDLSGLNLVDEKQQVLTTYTSLKIKKNAPCVYATKNGIIIPGVRINAEIKNYNKPLENGGWGNSDTTTSNYVLRDKCVEAAYEDYNAEDLTAGTDTHNLKQLKSLKGKSLKNVHLKQLSGRFYNEDPPDFDDTKCWLPGFGSKKGWNSSKGIIQSVRCGCITDTYSHLSKIVRFEEELLRCFKDVKLGNSPRKASYCERVIGIALCDTVSYGLSSLATQPSKSEREGEGYFDKITNFVQLFSGGDERLNKRYGNNNFFTQAGISSNQLANKACIWAVTGDISVLEAGILTALDRNQVAPSFLPGIPESRQQGYNPFTGELEIRYTFTLGVNSGGQDIRTRVKFVCDKNQAGGKFCPEEYLESDNPNSGSNIAFKSVLFTRANEVKQDSIIITDKSARFRYNVLILEHEYELNGKIETEKIPHTIIHKEEFLLASCYFTGGLLGQGSGIFCDKLFTDESSISFYELQDKTRLVPQGRNSKVTLYEGNPLILDTFLLSKSNDYENEQESLKLWYKVVCQNTQKYFDSIELNKIDSKSISGHEVNVLLPKIPKLEDENFFELEKESEFIGGITDIEIKLKENIKKSINLKINKITQNEKSLVGKLSLSFNENGKLENFEEISGKINFKRTGEIKIFFSEKPNSDIETITFLNRESPSPTASHKITFNFQTLKEIPNIREGSCNLLLRVEPSGIDLNSEEFEKNNQEKLSNVREKPYKSIPFFVKSQAQEKDKKFLFDIVTPYENQILCIDKENKTNSEFEVAGFFNTNDELINFNKDNNNKLIGKIKFQRINLETKKFNLNYKPNSKLFEFNSTFEFEGENSKTALKNIGKAPLNANFFVTYKKGKNDIETKSIKIKIKRCEE